nr:hypothetical protein [Sedimentitalea sp. CY04]
MGVMTSGKTLLSLVMVLGAVTLTACDSAKKKRPTYDGVPFKIKTKAVDKKNSRADFIVEIKDAGQSLEGARLAAAHAGVTYCLSEAGYGTSDIIWNINPRDPEAQLRLVDGAAVFQGTCES